MTAPAAGGIRVDLTIDGSKVAPEAQQALQKQLQPIIAQATKSVEQLDSALKKTGSNSGLHDVIAQAGKIDDALTRVTKSTTTASRAVQQYADSARAAYKKVADASKEVEQQEKALQERQKSGNTTWIKVQAEQVKQAKQAEAKAIKEAAAAYGEYERAARIGIGGNTLSDRLKATAGSAVGAGKDAANNFAQGFAGAASLTRLAGAGGPVGVAIGGIALLGFGIGKRLADEIDKGLSTLHTKDVFAASLGLDQATAARYGKQAAEAYAQQWGESIGDNLGAMQSAIQGGLLNNTSTDSAVQDVTAKLQSMKEVMGKDIPEVARAAGQLIRGGLAKDANEAFDIIIGGFQRGNDIAGDWLDTITEYSTQFRKLGIDGPEAVGLIQQGLQGAARDSDVVADSIKEFSIRAVDGSKSTAEGFKALGFDADDMAARFAQGGKTAHDAFGEVIRALKDTDDPMQQKLAWQDLFGTQWEDLGDAVNKFDLTSAGALGHVQGASDAATDAVSRHASEWDRLSRNVGNVFTKLREWLADSEIAKFLNIVPQALNDILDPAAAAKRYAPPGPIPGALPGTPLTPGNLPGLLTGPQGANTPGGLPGLLLPSTTPAPGQPPMPAPNLPAQGLRVPIVPDADQQKTQTDADKKKAIEAQFPLSQFINQMPGSTGQPPMQVNVTNMPPSLPGMPSLPGIPGMPTAAGGHLADWDKVAQLESSGNWKINTGNGFFGGLQFTADSWKAAGGLQFAPSAEQATPEQQKAAADKLLQMQCPGAWPNTLAPHPEWLTPGGGGTPLPMAGAPAPSGMAPMPGESPRDFAHRVMQPFWESMGLQVGDHQADKYGEHQNGALDVMVPSIQAGQQVLQQVLSDPNVYGAIFNNQTYGYGHGTTPQDYTAGHTGDPNQDHTNHVHVWYKPGNAGNIPGGGFPGGVPFSQNMFATNGPLQMDPTTGQVGSFQVDQQAVWEATNARDRANYELAKAAREYAIVVEEQKQNLATESDVIDARQKAIDAQNGVTKAEADLAEKKRGSFKASQPMDYSKLPFGDPRRILAGAITGAGGTTEDAAAILGPIFASAGAPIGNVVGDVTGTIAGFPLPGPMGYQGTPTAPSTGLNQLAQERNPLFLAQASGFNVPDYSRQGGGPSAQNLMTNTGAPFDAQGRIYSDTAALIDRTFTNLDAAEKARHDQVMAVLNEVRDKLSKDVLAPVVKQGVADGMGAMGDGVTAALGNSMGQAAGPPIASAVANAIPSGGGDGGGNAGAALVNTGATAVANIGSAAMSINSGGFHSFDFGGAGMFSPLPIGMGPLGNLYDEGGLWPHGTFGTNLSGAPERVLDPDQTRLFDAGLLGGWNLQPQQQNFATVKGVDASATVGADFFGVSQVPILGAIVNLLVAVLLKVIGVQVQARDTLNEISSDFRDFRGDFKAFDAQGRLMNDTSGLVDRSTSNEQTAADERIRILKQVLEGLLQFIIEKIIVPIGKAIANSLIQAAAGAANGALSASFPGGSIVGGAVSSVISSAGSAAVDIVSQVGTILAESLINVGLDAIGSLIQSYLPDLSNLVFGGGLLAAITDPISHGLTSLLGGFGMAFSGLFGGLASLVPGLPFDNGGIASGIGLIPKATIRPERVLSPNQTAAFEQLPGELRSLVTALRSGTIGGGGDKTITFHITGNDPNRIASRVRTELADALN